MDSQLRTVTQFVKLDPNEVHHRHLLSSVRADNTYARDAWTQSTLEHARADVSHMLLQLDGFTVTQAELGGHRWSKRFLDALPIAA